MESRLHWGIDLDEPGEGLVDDQRLARCIGGLSDLAKGARAEDRAGKGVRIRMRSMSASSSRERSSSAYG